MATAYAFSNSDGVGVKNLHHLSCDAHNYTPYIFENFCFVLLNFCVYLQLKWILGYILDISALLGIPLMVNNALWLATFIHANVLRDYFCFHYSICESSRRK